MLHLDITADPSPADEALVMAGTRAHNAAFMQADAKRLCVFARDAAGAIIGGVTASTYWHYLDVKFLWVHEQHRHLGLATQVMRAAHAEAWRRGCKNVFLDTFSFQARGFYERLGYREFGRLSGFSGQHERHFMHKALTDPHA